MSRIGKKPVAIPAGVTVKLEGSTLEAKGPNGHVSMTIPEGIRAELRQGAEVLFSADHEEDKTIKALHGLARSQCFNMMEGVTKGYAKNLEIQGVGYRAKVDGKKLIVTLGYSHPVEYPIPEEIKIDVQDQVRVKISGADKCLVGEVAAQIRRFMPPEPYKGKGIRYAGEAVRRKAGKTVG